MGFQSPSKPFIEKKTYDKIFIPRLAVGRLFPDSKNRHGVVVARGYKDSAAAGRKKF
jgi:hypothetical protein